MARTTSKKSSSYTADSIRSLSAHQHLLKRISLTFGAELGDTKNPYSTQKTVAIREIIDNAIDEIRAGFGSAVKVVFAKDGSISVTDSGRGVPVDSSTDASGRKVSGIYKALGIIQSGGKFGGGSEFSSGLNGVGASSTVHLSKRADVVVARGGKLYSISFQDGTPGFFEDEDEDNPSPDSVFKALDKDKYDTLKVSKDTRSKAEKSEYPTGTMVRVWLRDSVFQSQYPVNVDDLIERLKYTAYLVPSLKVEIFNEHRLIEDPETGASEPQHELYHFEDGVRELLRVSQESAPIIEPIHIVTEGSFTEKNVPVLQDDGSVVNKDVSRRVPVELMLVWGEGYEYSLSSYVNTINTKLGGSHEVGFRKAIEESFNKRFATMRGLIPKGDSMPVFEDFSEGMTAVLSIQVSEPSFTSQTKEQLGGTEVRKAVYESLSKELEKWISSRSNSDALQLVAQKVVAASKARQRAKEKRELDRKKNQISSSTTLPVKLIDCEYAGSDDRASLYICEGDSALSSLKASRDGRFDALLGIRGKIINAHKQTAKRVLDNSEVQDIIRSLGAGYGSDFDVDAMRYGRVFIAVDADPDGNAIACLIYALFWHYFRPVIEEGRLFKIETPLFSISTKEGRKSRKIYARDEKERDKAVRDLEKRKVKYSISRLKGLGEVEPEILEETAINPETRVVTQVSVANIEAAFESLDLIFGDDTDSRKEWMGNYEVDEEDLL